MYLTLTDLDVSVQFSCSDVSDSLRPPWTIVLQAITNSRSLLKLMSIELMMPPSLVACNGM